MLCALLGLVCLASAQRSMGPASAPAPAPGRVNAKHVHFVIRVVGSMVGTEVSRVVGPSGMMAPEVAPAGETAPSVADAPAPATVELVCPCALEKGTYDVTATNLADILRSRADCPLDMTAGSGCPSGNYG